MNDKKTVLYIGNFSFPFGNASGKRVYANGKVLRNLGYRVLFIGVDKEISKTDTLKSTHKEFDGFDYYNFSYPQNNLEWVNYKKILVELISFLEKEKLIEDLALVIYYGSPRLSIFNTRLIQYCNNNNIKIIADCVDWLTTKTNNIIFNIVKSIDNTYQKAYANKKADGVIAISSYLANYYEKYGCKTVIIPPLSPIKYELSSQRLVENDNKIIAYAGIPFRKGHRVKEFSVLKDRIDKTIKLLYQAKEEGCKFIFNIYGFTKEEYLFAIPEQKLYIDNLRENLIFHGPRPYEEVVKEIINSDFTILFRDVNRDTSAGFPTKFVESVSCGTPVITTRTSDLEEYLIEGKTGFFLDFDERMAVEKLICILRVDKTQIISMKDSCLKYQMFDYDKFSEKLGDFLKLLGLNTKGIEQHCTERVK